MTKIAIQPSGSGSGTFTIAAPNSNENRTFTLPDESGELLTLDFFAENVPENATPVRQTVLTGPVDSDGRADFLEAGTGLQITTTSLDPPLIVTYGDGFSSKGATNHFREISQSLTWNLLPDDEDEVFLFLRISNETLSTFHSTLAPIYGQSLPSSPATGQTFYPTDHRHRMLKYDGSAWNDADLIICVGQCTTDGGDVVDVRSYAYQGKSTTKEDWPTTSQRVVSSHNLGLDGINVSARALLKITSAQGDYDVGDVLDLNSYGRSRSGDRDNGVSTQGKNAVGFRYTNSSSFMRRDTGAGAAIDSSGVELFFVIERSF